MRNLNNQLISKLSIGALLIAAASSQAVAQSNNENSESSGQRADKGFVAIVPKPRFAKGTGPRVAIDCGHGNYHTATGRYQPFAEVLRADGYQVQSIDSQFSSKNLAGIDVLVIANALAERNQRDWSLPTPSAFTKPEIETLAKWVRDGGSLMLIADHMPFPGAAEALASEFGLELFNGFVFDKDRNGSLRFDAGENKLMHLPVKNSSDSESPIKWVQTFTGSCFKGDTSFSPLFVLGTDCYSLEPQVAWEFDSDTPRRDVSGYWQAAVRDFGQGRMAMFGEAAMFTAQQSSRARRFGLAHPDAEFNQQFLLNIVHWLAKSKASDD